MGNLGEGMVCAQLCSLWASVSACRRASSLGSLIPGALSELALPLQGDLLLVAQYCQ